MASYTFFSVKDKFYPQEFDAALLGLSTIILN